MIMEQSGVVLVRFLTPARWEQLLAAVKASGSAYATRDLAWLRLLESTGMRIGEFSRLTIGRLRDALATGWIYVPAAERKGGKRAHSYAVTGRVREAILLLLDHAGPDASSDAPAVASRHGGKPLSTRSYQDRLARYAEAAGLVCSPHWMRHTRAMNILRKGKSRDPIRIIQAALGHASASTARLYTRVAADELAEALEQVDGPVRGATGRRAARALFEQRAGVPA
jgi:site-specific recombinase XerD